MNRYIAGALTGFVVLAAFELPHASAQPQVPSGPARPVFSPYLNMLNGGNPAVNYFGLVVPQMQMQQQLSQLQMQQQLSTGNQSTVQTGASSALYPPTGNVPVFNNTYQYFNRVYIGSGTSGGGASGTPSLSGGSFNRMGGSFGSTGTGAAAGFQRGGTGAGGLQPSFAAPTTRPPAGGGQPPR